MASYGNVRFNNQHRNHQQPKNKNNFVDQAEEEEEEEDRQTEEYKQNFEGEEHDGQYSNQKQFQQNDQYYQQYQTPNNNNSNNQNYYNHQNPNSNHLQNQQGFNFNARGQPDNDFYLNMLTGSAQNDDNNHNQDEQDQEVDQSNEQSNQLQMRDLDEFLEQISIDIEENKIVDSLESCSQIVKSAHPQQFQQIYDKILKFLSQETVSALNLNKFDKVLFMLEKSFEIAQLQTNPPSPLVALIYNNQGCYYRRMKQLPKALSYLDHALKYLNEIKSSEYLGMTYLNISAILSQMGEHYSSLDKAKKAVLEINKTYKEAMSRKSDPNAQEEIKDISKALAIAFYNTGVEQEHFENFELANTNFGKAVKVCVDNLGEDSQLTQRFKQLHEKFQTKMEQQKIKQKLEQAQLQKKLSLSPNNKNNTSVSSSNKKRSLRLNLAPPQKNHNLSNQSTSSKNSKINILGKIFPYMNSYGVKEDLFFQQGNKLNFKSLNEKGQNSPQSLGYSQQSFDQFLQLIRIFYQNSQALNNGDSGQKVQRQVRNPRYQQNPNKQSQSLTSLPIPKSIRNNGSGISLQQKPSIYQCIRKNPSSKIKERQKQMVIGSPNSNQPENITFSPKQDALSWEDKDPIEENNQEVAINQKQFLENIQNENLKLQQEEKEIRDRIEALKQQELKEQMDQEEKQLKEEEIENQRREEEARAKRLLEEILEKKREEEEELFQIQQKKEEEERLIKQKEQQIEEFKRKNEEVMLMSQVQKDTILKELEENQSEEERNLQQIKEQNEEELSILKGIERKYQQLLDKQKEIKQKQQENNLQTPIVDTNLKKGAQQLQDHNQQLKLDNEKLAKQIKQEQENLKKIDEVIQRKREEEENEANKRKKKEEEQANSRKREEEIETNRRRKEEEDETNRRRKEEEEEEIRKRRENRNYIQRKKCNRNYDLGIEDIEEQNILRIYSIPSLITESENLLDIDTSQLQEQHRRQIIEKLADFLIKTIQLNKKNEPEIQDNKWSETDSENEFTLNSDHNNSWSVGVKQIEKVGRFGISEDPASIQKVTMIQNNYKDKKLKEKAQKDLKKAVDEVKQVLNHRIIEHKNYKFYVEGFKKIVPDTLVIQINSLNPKEQNLKKIVHQEEVNQDFFDKVAQSPNPFESGLIKLDEQNNVLKFNTQQEEQAQKEEDNYEEERFEEEENIEKGDNQVPPSGGGLVIQGREAISKEKQKYLESKNKKDQDKSHVEDIGKKDDEQEDDDDDDGDDDENEKEENKEDEVNNLEQKDKAARVIQNQVVAKKKKKNQKKLYQQRSRGKIQDNISFENLLAKPARWFAKLKISSFLSKELIARSKEKSFSPLDYFQLLFEEKIIVLTEKARNVAVKFIQQFYNSYFKEIFYKVEKLSDTKYIFCLQKVSQKKKDVSSTYRIRVESMKNRQVNHLCPVHVFVARYILAQQKQKTLQFAQIFDIDTRDLEMTIKQDQQSLIFQNALRRLLKIRVSLNHIRRNIVAVTFGIKATLDDFPKNTYFFSLSHYKNPTKFVASIDSIKCPNKYERLQCTLALKRYQYRFIFDTAKKLKNFNTQDYFDYDYRDNTIALKEGIKQQLLKEVALAFILKLLAKKRIQERFDKEFELILTTTLRINKTLFVIFIIKYLNKQVTEIRFERISSWQSKETLKKNKEKYFARLPIDSSLADILSSQSKIPSNSSDPKKNYIFKYITFDQKLMKLALREDYIQKPRIILQEWKDFNYQRKNVMCEIQVEYNSSTNQLTFMATEAGWKGCQKQLDVNNPSEQQLVEIATKDFNNIILVNDTLHIVGAEKENATKVLQKQIVDEQVIKSQQFQMRMNDLDGNSLILGGECRLIRKMRNYYLVIYKNPNLELQQRVDLGKLNKQKKQQFIKQFSNIVSSSITLQGSNLQFEDLPDFSSDQPIRLSVIHS